MIALGLGSASADTGGKDIVIDGINAYKENGAKAAIETWIKGSALEGSKEALSQANSIRQIEDFYGNYIGYEIVKEHAISDRSSMFLFVINLEKGPIFGRFQTYRKADNQWVASHFNFHTQATATWPEKSVFGE